MQAILFIGIQASGKTTFYLNNFFRTHVYISLDQLNTRNKEAQFIDTCLSTQQAFVVDNTNPTRAERKGYIEKAKARNFRVIAYYFQSSLEQALSWNAQREGKARIPELGIKGTYRFNDLPSWQKRGIGAYWKRYSKEGVDPVLGQSARVERSALYIDLDLPMRENYSQMLSDFLGS